MLDNKSGINFGSKTFIKNDLTKSTNSTTSFVEFNKNNKFVFLAKEMRFLNGDSTSD